MRSAWPGAAGYWCALEVAGLPVDPDLTVRSQLTREGGPTVARTLPDRTDRPTHRLPLCPPDLTPGRTYGQRRRDRARPEPLP